MEQEDEAQARRADLTFESGARDALKQLRKLLEAMRTAEVETSEELAAVAEGAREGARNLVHYVTFRRFDVRPLQEQLADLGLSSLGRSEARIYDAMTNVARALAALLGESSERPKPCLTAAPQQLLRENARALLGTCAQTAIMVTLPSEAAHDYGLVRALLSAGMHVARINCAHDDEDAWRAMVAHLAQARSELGANCRVLFDLPGPKLRTLSVAPGPRVVRWSPTRDDFGAVTQPARVLLRGFDEPPQSVDARELALPAAFVQQLDVGDRVHFKDARGRQRSLRVVERTGEGVWSELKRTAYVVETTSFRHRHAGKTRPLCIPPRAQTIALETGDTLVLTADGAPGAPAVYDEAGVVVTPARIACALPEVVRSLERGAPVMFDDGKITGEVTAVDETQALVRITDAGAGRAKLGSEKGINLPELTLDLPAINEDDRRALAVAVECADMVGLSFARSPRDVRMLHAELAALGARELGVVLKIETKRGFEHLPAMLLEALKRPSLGVMIARGDLAVECGFERLAELQEEILWLCEAAHVPAIWATQVLERLAKKGRATRAEITDAAMAVRAECVMLNKGPHIVRTVETLSNILERMHGHQQKKRALLRPLRSPRLSVDPPEPKRTRNQSAPPVS